jgi:hypothetical protein
MKKTLLILGLVAVVSSFMPVMAAPNGGHGMPQGGAHQMQPPVNEHVMDGAPRDGGFREALPPRVAHRHGSGISIYTGFPRRSYWGEPCDCRIGWYDGGYYDYDGFYVPRCRHYRPVSGAGFYISF